MVGVRRRIKLRRAVETKGVKLKAGQIVTVVDYPTIKGRDYYNPNCTVLVKGYGRVSIPKTALHISALEKLIRAVYRKPKKRKKRR